MSKCVVDDGEGVVAMCRCSVVVKKIVKNNERSKIMREVVDELCSRTEALRCVVSV